MMHNSLNTQGKAFREEETSLLFDYIQAGESVSIIGISGTGKSNLFDHICDPTIQADYFPSGPDRPIVLRVNFHYAPDFSDRSLYSLILEQIEALAGETAISLGIEPSILQLVANYHDELIEARGDALKVQRLFKRAIRQIMAGSKRKLVFLFDQFDDVYRDADAHFFANLRGLRQAYKYRVLYMTFTRDLLPHIAESDSGREEFYELMTGNLMGLRPYQEADSRRLIKRIAKRNKITVLEAVQTQMIELCGGHGGLLRAVLLTIGRARDGLPTDHETAVSVLLKVSSVTLECEKIWRSLDGHEQKLLHHLTSDLPANKVDEKIVERLRIKGILNKQEMFSLLFAEYAKRQDPEWERPLSFNQQSRQVWVLGEPISPLTKLEYRLFRHLYEHANELVVKDDLINEAWPNAHGGVTDEALTAAMARLRRKVEPDSKNPRFFENVRNQGYILHRKQQASA